VIAADIATTYASTEVTFSQTTAAAADDTVSVTIDGQTFTTAKLVIGDNSAIKIGDAFTARSDSYTGWTITDGDDGKVTFTKNADYVGGTTGGSSSDTGQTAISTSSVTVTTAGTGTGEWTAAANDSARGNIGATTGTNAKIINEHTGFEVTVASALNNASGELSVSSVVKAVDVFVDDTDVLSASAAMQAVRVVDDAVAMIGRERAGLGAFQNRLEQTKKMK
jgi:flagellin-like hook-associated protein FlgL